MAKRSFSRREFFKISALSSTSIALASCTSLDQFFMGDSHNLEAEVVILGAGAAGLAAAYNLKKNKIPFRIFEASSRIGGRVQTVSLYPGAEAPVAELGAEFFDNSHRVVFDLAKELGLQAAPIKGVKNLEPHIFVFGGKVYKVQDLKSRLKTLNAPLKKAQTELLERASYYDSISLAQLLNEWSSQVDPLILKLIEVQAVARFGADAKDQSAMHFISTLEGESSSLLEGRDVFRMTGGMSALVQGMYERVTGAIPNYNVRFNSALTSISEKKDVFELIFKTPNGNEKFTTKTVICTLPFSTLRDINGIQSLNFTGIKKNLINEMTYATHTKGVIGFDKPFWRTKTAGVPANLGNFTGDFKTQKIWDSGRAQPGDQGLLTFSRAGQSGLEAGANAFNETISDLKIIYSDIESRKIEESQLINWSQRSWSKGSMAYYKPGQFLKYRGVAGESEYNGRFLFAGEHASLRFPGTVQGALETGLLAAATSRQWMLPPTTTGTI
jgi:monoamine oxidase